MRLASCSAAWSGWVRGTAGSAIRSDDCTEPGRSTSSSGPGSSGGVGRQVDLLAAAVPAAQRPLGGVERLLRVEVADQHQRARRPGAPARRAAPRSCAGRRPRAPASGLGRLHRVRVLAVHPLEQRDPGQVRRLALGHLDVVDQPVALGGDLVGRVGRRRSSTSARISSSRSSPVTSALPETSSRSGSSPADSPPPTVCSSAAMSTVDIRAGAGEQRLRQHRAAGQVAPGANGTRSRTSTSGTDGPPDRDAR